MAQTWVRQLYCDTREGTVPNSVGPTLQNPRFWSFLASTLRGISGAINVFARQPRVPGIKREYETRPALELDSSIEHIPLVLYPACTVSYRITISA